MEEWRRTQTEPASGTPPVHLERLPTTFGTTAPLCALNTAEEPAQGANHLTSINGGLVLNSAAVQLGEYGTARELAESELYHWADACAFRTLQYTQPMQLGAHRYTVHLKLDNGTIGMEQLVIYTDLGNGIARVDRLWRAIPDIRTDTGSAVFDKTAAYLISNRTL